MSWVRVFAMGTVLVACAYLMSCFALGVDRGLIPPDGGASAATCGCACLPDPTPECLAPLVGQDGSSDAAADRDALVSDAPSDRNDGSQDALTDAPADADSSDG